MKLSELGFVRCVVCSKKLYGAFPGAENTDINSVAIHSGVAIETKIGYGSQYDGDTLVLGLCDVCIHLRKNIGSLRHFPCG